APAAPRVGHRAQPPGGARGGAPVPEPLPRPLGAAAHVIEPPDPVERLAQYQEGPLLADRADRRADRAVLRVVLKNPGPRHVCMLNLVDRFSNVDEGWVRGANSGKHRADREFCDTTAV